ncbi:MAG TPA: inositol monophosphatase [Porticoccaceae bacterium]|nr:inositol monophosphatase [Porticoccaceae bacterium]
MEPMINIALRAARSAGELILRASARADRLKISEKSQNDFVSEVDHASEQEILKQLKKTYPEHCFICEEGGRIIGTESDAEWIIDPLDGTTNFLRGIPHYAISIAFRHKGRLQHGVVYDPIKREEFTASRGRGAFLNGNRIRVSGRLQGKGALYGTGIPFSGKPYENISPYLLSLAGLADHSAGIRRLGVASLDLAYVAAGRLDAFWEMYLKPWDIAAGVLLVQEAGGLVADFQGGDHFMDSGHIVAATPRLLKPTLQTVGKHLGHVK